MDTALGVVGWVVIISMVVAWRRSERARRSGGPTGPGRPRTPTGRRAGGRGPGLPGAVTGVLLGHAVARGHHAGHGMPGDPLPHGHLGSPGDLAFWSALGERLEQDEERDQE